MIWDHIINWDLFENAMVVQHKEQMNTITILIELRRKTHYHLYKMPKRHFTKFSNH